MKTFNEMLVEIAGQLGCSPEVLAKLIQKTNEMESVGARFANLSKYASDTSDNSEEASHRVVLNFDYANMVEQERKALEEFDIATADVEAYDYGRIDLDGASLEDYKAAVRAKLPEALAALKGPKKEKDTSADIWLNKVLVFNTNTVRLSMVGQSVKKTVLEEGEFHKPKSKALTVAKDIIRYQAGCRTSKYRRYALDNFLNGAVSLQGETLELG